MSGQRHGVVLPLPGASESAEQGDAKTLGMTTVQLLSACCFPLEILNWTEVARETLLPRSTKLADAELRSSCRSFMVPPGSGLRA